jgi:AsmA family protein
MDDALSGVRLLRRAGVALLALGLAAVVAVGILLGLADRGLFDARIARWASARLHRPVRIGGLRLHLLARDPTITLDHLEIGNPAWLHGGDLVKIDTLTAHVEPGWLLAGRLRARTIVAKGVQLHLIRFAPRRNNWTLTDHPRPGPAFAPLATTQALIIDDAHVDVRDYGRDLFLSGPFRHLAAGARPFSFRAEGQLKGFPVSLALRGGQLNGPGVGPAWPFHAQLRDAVTWLDAQGVSGQPFDLGSYDLGLTAHGPNLADLGYLFRFSMPNSAPYAIRLRARSDGDHFGFSNLQGVMGRSDLSGWIQSDHSRDHRRIRAAFRLAQLDRSDVDALLSEIPPREKARAVSGAVKGVATGRWLLPDAPFGLARIRASDFDFTIHAARMSGYPLPLRTVSTRIVSTGGRLRVPAFRASLYGGAVTGSGQLDARTDTPHLSVEGRLQAAKLAAIGFRQPSSAELTAEIRMAGTGLSVHDAAGHASGTATMRVTGATMPRRAGWILAGDLLRAIANPGARDAPAEIPIGCAAASFQSTGSGIFQLTGLGVESPLGHAQGTGAVDLGQETVAMILQGQPNRKRLLQLTTPVRLAGPLLHPSVSLLPGGGARALGLKGAIGVGLTPIAGLLPIKDKALRFAPMIACQ